jgi:serine/threonine protein kinase
MIGSGVQGMVFLAYDTLKETKVAIKILAQGANNIENQKREIQVLLDIRDANLTEGFPLLIDFCKSNANYVITELLSTR